MIVPTDTYAVRTTLDTQLVRYFGLEDDAKRQRDRALHALFDVPCDAETEKSFPPRYLTQEELEQGMGAGAGDRCGESESRESIPLSPLSDAFPKDRGVRRSFSVRKKRPPRPEVRAYELGMQLQNL